MVYKIEQLHVPFDDPFRNDALSRKNTVEFLAGLIDRTGGPFVLAIDSPWGTGKTTFINMLHAVLRQKNFECVHFNAWKVDYVIDPLVALVSTIDQIKISDDQSASTFKSHMNVLRRVTTTIAKRTGIAAVKAATLGAVDLAEEIEAVLSDLAGEAAEDVVNAFQRDTEALEDFRTQLTAVVSELGAAGKNPTLVFFIDELDRCRPPFSIALLERIKHLFDVPNVVFVLSIDKSQLEASISSVYGSGINAPEYLRRFIDLEYCLPKIDGSAFTEVLLAQFDIDRVFRERGGGDDANDRKDFSLFFTALADLTGLSLRARERCFTRMTIVLDQTPHDRYLHPILVAFLIVIRTKDPSLFDRVAHGAVGSDELMKYLGEFPQGPKFLSNPICKILEAHLIATDADEMRRSAKQQTLQQVSEDMTQESATRRRAEEVLSLLNFHSTRGSDIRFTASKIDIAIGINS